MSRAWSRLAACPLLGILCLATVACASLPGRTPQPSEDRPSVDRKRHNADVAAAFEAKRTQAQYEAAVAFFQQGDLNAAHEQATAVIKRDPRHPAARALLAQLARAAPRNDPTAATDVAAVSYESSAEPVQGGSARQDARQVNTQAVQLLRSAQPDAAATRIRAALARGKASADLYRTLAVAEYRLENYQASQSALQQALSLDNGHPLSYFLMGFTLQRLGDSDGAAWHFRRAEAIDPKYVSPR
ncbi:MAG: hypothetical protein DWQ31_14420 [Planctomycetota bacterium]|nr:MAG: hypothetical protein DWQ31_14420 [Planctomycetota bacterium]REJ94561.1 MAG: hypothetical protein DWQ35_08125 [Planctomycetota bacterium]REK18576.1 MAG: hypothetical protein DWQ42_19345 [Planctomycetota bacterium]REK37471.1 MAG: hypothetical protein DWQ46_21820 [Planctomycetota bacterium]